MEDITVPSILPLIAPDSIIVIYYAMINFNCPSCPSMMRHIFPLAQNGMFWQNAWRWFRETWCLELAAVLALL